MALTLSLLIGIALIVLLIIVFAHRQAIAIHDESDEDGSLAASESPHPELAFFNSLDGVLKIDLDIPATPIGTLQNLEASPDARITQLSLRAGVFDEDTEESRELTTEELDRVAFRGGTIRLRGDSGPAVEHHAANGSAFTVRELLRAVEETERRTRGQSDWLGGIDVHHIYFEGIHPAADDVWEIHWGS